MKLTKGPALDPHCKTLSAKRSSPGKGVEEGYWIIFWVLFEKENGRPRTASFEGAGAKGVTKGNEILPQ